MKSTRPSRIKDISGKRFAKLQVKTLSHRGADGRYYWFCICDCGNEAILQGRRIREGHTKSCGCLQMEGSRKSPGYSAFKRRLRTYKYAAKSRNLCFDLTEEQFRSIIEKSCSYCGSLPKPYDASGESYGSISITGIDRKQNDIGYTIDNCVSCCIQCNQAKMAHSFEDFLAWVRRVYHNTKNMNEIKALP